MEELGLTNYGTDTVLLADSKENLQNTMNKVNEGGKLYNMKMNAKKTKAMVISRTEKKSKVNIKVDGTAVEQDDGSSVDEIKKRIGLPKPHYQK